MAYLRQMKPSGAFGIVSVAVSLWAFYLGFSEPHDSALFVTMMTWGSVFLLVGIALLLVDRIF
mgnify:CR=1 FL=1